MKRPRNLLFCLFLAITVFLLSFCSDRSLMAQDAGPAAVTSIPIPVVSSSAEKDPGAVMTPLSKGQKAPFSGTLLSPKSIAILIAELHALPRKCDIEIETATSRCKADLEFQMGMCQTKYDADTQILNSRLKMLNDIDALNKKKIAELEKSQTNPLFWIAGGVIGGVLVTGAIVYISHR